MIGLNEPIENQSKDNTNGNRTIIERIGLQNNRFLNKPLTNYMIPSRC
jgi:hypothetical protein